MVNTKTSIRRRCPYCMDEFEVVHISARSIEGYCNHITGKNTAIVEHLSCGHEYVDNRFNVDAIYFHNPETKCLEPKFRERVAYVPYKRKGMNAMDVCVLGCMVCLAVMFPPLIVLPVLYFSGRLNSR